MIVSMTGFGKAAKAIKKINISVELRSINSKFLEVSTRMPMVFSDKEAEIKEVIGQKISRGKVTVNLSIDKNANNNVTLQIQPDIIKDYYKLLTGIKKATGIKEEIKIEHILKFSEIFKAEDTDELVDYWNDIKKVIQAAVNDLYTMKKKEGRVLEKDILSRVNSIRRKLEAVVKHSNKNLKDTKEKMMEKVNNFIEEAKVDVDRNRLEYELTMISDRLDITEEVTRANSHIDYFINNVKESELSGRRLNFLVQEINREINTMASKSNSSDISHLVVEMKEELEKVKEQLQNIE
jgi:uncharacterized protein (TIGR00255 family)